MNMPSVLAICSGKGGVGKSTISFYLAKLLTHHSYKVGLIDADVCGPSLHLFFKDLSNSKPDICGDLIKPPCIEGIHFMSSAFYFPGGAFIRAPKANALIKSFFENVTWPDLDLIIVDFPPGTGDVCLTLFQEVAFHGAFVVSTPHDLSVEDAAKSCKMIQEASIPLIGIIENMAYLDTLNGKVSLFGEGGGQELIDLFNIPSLISVPFFIDKGEPLDENYYKALFNCKKIIDKNVLNKILCTK